MAYVMRSTYGWRVEKSYESRSNNRPRANNRIREICDTKEGCYPHVRGFSHVFTQKKKFWEERMSPTSLHMKLA